MFENKDTAEYYNTTQHHYENWWNLGDTLALHYGIWDDTTNSFSDSLINTNKILFEKGKIEDGHKVLDAGCGVGGAAFFIASKKNVKVTGITLSKKQIKLATDKAIENGLSDRVSFVERDYTNTGFEDESYDVIWACESICHAVDKADFVKEAFRLLKKGGRLILCDYYLVNDNQVDKHNYIQKWLKTWSITRITSSDYFENKLKEGGFSHIETTDYTSAITKSAWKMFLAGIIGALPSIAYNLTHPDASRFGKTHYKGCYYQYVALVKNLWKWKMMYAEKPA